MNGLPVDNADGRVERALRGQALYGDDFSDDEIAAWFDDEREGYFDLYGGSGAEADTKASYTYAALAMEHNYRWLPDRPFPAVLGIGSADGAELIPLLPRSERITVLEPSDGFAATHIAGRPVTYVKPDPGGDMPFDAGSFDLIVCFHVLHHIPNVSKVLREMFRVLKPGGYALLREPTHSMGDWRRPRHGLTKRERGIPPAIFRSIVADAGFAVEHEALCYFSLLARVPPVKGRHLLSYRWGVRLDGLICRLPVWPRRYHATRTWHKFRPVSVAFVLRKP